MAKLKRTLEISFLALASIVILSQLAMVVISWIKNRTIDKEIWKSVQVSVVKPDPQFPPGLLIDYENTGKWNVSKTHFRLVFEAEGREVSRSDRDYGEVKAGEKRRIYLKSAVPVSSLSEVPRLAKVFYRLLVFPNKKKPLPEIVGEIELQ